MKLKGFKGLTNNKKIITYHNPNYVYIPLINQYDTNITVLVKKGETVQIGTILGKRKGDIKSPIISSISGKVIDFTDKYYCNGELVKCVVIENDFKETKNYKEEINKNINKMTKEDFINTLRDGGIIGMGGGGFPAYIKYSASKLDTLIINAVECEPYITSDNAIGLEKIDDILEITDNILEINNMKEAIFVCKDTNLELIKVVNDHIASYPKIIIKTVSNYYPAGYERSIIKDVLNLTYGRFPSEINIVVNNISTIYSMYELLKFNKPQVNRVVTITGNAIKNPVNVNLKIGTLAQDIINYIGNYTDKDENVLFIAGGPMMGSSIKTDELVVSANLNAIVITNDIPDTEVNNCIKCGKCILVCPMTLEPVIIMRNVKHKKKVSHLFPEKCIECGLCSYICPSNIDVRGIIKAAKELARGEKQ